VSPPQACVCSVSPLGHQRRALTVGDRGGSAVTADSAPSRGEPAPPGASQALFAFVTPCPAGMQLPPGRPHPQRWRRRVSRYMSRTASIRSGTRRRRIDGPGCPSAAAGAGHRPARRARVKSTYSSAGRVSMTRVMASPCGAGRSPALRGSARTTTGISVLRRACLRRSHEGGVCRVRMYGEAPRTQTHSQVHLRPRRCESPATRAAVTGPAPISRRAVQMSSGEGLAADSALGWPTRTGGLLVGLGGVSTGSSTLSTTSRARAASGCRCTRPATTRSA
jgi:hypothetical protein